MSLLCLFLLRDSVRLYRWDSQSPFIESTVKTSPLKIVKVHRNHAEPIFPAPSTWTWSRECTHTSWVSPGLLGLDPTQRTVVCETGTPPGWRHSRSKTEMAPNYWTYSQKQWWIWLGLWISFLWRIVGVAPILHGFLYNFKFNMSDFI